MVEQTPFFGWPQQKLKIDESPRFCALKKTVGRTTKRCLWTHKEHAVPTCKLVTRLLSVAAINSHIRAVSQKGEQRSGRARAREPVLTCLCASHLSSHHVTGWETVGPWGVRIKQEQCEVDRVPVTDAVCWWGSTPPPPDVYARG